MPPPREPTEAPVVSPHPIYTWLDRELLKREMSWAKLCRLTEISNSTFHRWRDRKINPSIPMIRRVADVLGYEPQDRLRIFVIAEILEPSEVRQTVTSPDPALLTNEELLFEVKDRMRPFKDTGNA